MDENKGKDKKDHIITNADEIIEIAEADKNIPDPADAKGGAFRGYGPAKSKKNHGHSEFEKPEEHTTDEGGTLIYKNLSQVMHESMIPYSEYVILDRALPRVEDGLKPVQRRVLFAMHDMGLLPDRPYRKSAGIVGECLGKYHPHGDTSVYDAMVRLAQPFNMNMPLVIGQGNFGSEDGDPPAAMRYTEAKLSPLALELLRDIDKETVPFSLTFDDRNVEPDILPGRYPNLLTNGATGIAVGLATNIPPHNLAEVIDAHIAYIDNPRITLPAIMKIIKGPDFPTAGFVITGDDLVRAYTTGKGKVIMRGRVHIEIEPGDRRNIVISELPYQVNKVTLQRNIADLREAKKGILQGISEIRDESDRKGMRVVIKVKNGFDARAISELLFKHTNLQCNYNINMVAIANGKPRLLGLMQLIQYYCEYQREIILKRCIHDLHQARERAHILEGLLVAIKNIDEVVRIIKTSKHTTEARGRLREAFELSEKQAQAILDLRLARLTSLEVYKLEQELEELKKLIEKLEKIIASKRLQYEEVKKEMLEIKRKHKVERRSKILAKIEDAIVTADDDAKPVEEVVIALTAGGTIKRMSAKHFSMSQTEFKDGMGLFETHTNILSTQTDKLLYIFTQSGNCYKIDAGDIPECKLRDKGLKLGQLFKGAPETELPVSVYAIVHEQLPAEEDESKDKKEKAKKEKGPGLSPELVWLSKYGMIKRSTWTESCGVIKSVFQCGKLTRDDDAILTVDEFRAGDKILLLTTTGMVLHATTGDVPVQGRIAGGVKGINFGTETEWCACNAVAGADTFLVAVTNKGNVKRTAVKGIEKMVRYRKGLQFGGLDKNEEIIFGAIARGDEDIVVKTEEGAVASCPVEKIPLTERTGKFRQFPLKPNLKPVEGWVHQRTKR
ncbi:MAG: DNA topoisomerase 4 subunit A [Firmicutes bacterium]|nr:DNA topoisomerase 4 subunit A [Bacillota bacterium]